MYGTPEITSLARMADWVLNWLTITWVLALSGRALGQWIRRGRIESYSQNELMPKCLRRWLGADSEPTMQTGGRSTTVKITVSGWVFIGCIAICLFAKAV